MCHVLVYYLHHYEGQFHERDSNERLHIMKDNWEDIIARLQNNAVSTSYTGYYTGMHRESDIEEAPSF
jgi:hypothetical protein